MLYYFTQLWGYFDNNITTVRDIYREPQTERDIL